MPLQSSSFDFVTFLKRAFRSGDKRGLVASSLPLAKGLIRQVRKGRFRYLRQVPTGTGTVRKRLPRRS